MKLDWLLNLAPSALLNYASHEIFRLEQNFSLFFFYWLKSISFLQNKCFYFAFVSCSQRKKSRKKIDQILRHYKYEVLSRIISYITKASFLRKTCFFISNKKDLKFLDFNSTQIEKE